MSSSSRLSKTFFASVLLLASAAQAQEAKSDAVPRPEIPGLAVPSCPEFERLRAGAEFDGENGVWFPKRTATCILARLRGLNELVVYVRWLEERRDAVIALRDVDMQRLELAKEEALVASSHLEEAVRAIADADALHRSPLLWFTVGVAVSVAGAIALAVAL